MSKYLITGINSITFWGLVCIFSSCKKEEVPLVTTTLITNITETSAFSGGTVTDAGSETILAKGVCWSTDTKPTINGSKTDDGSGAGTFTSNLSGLKENTIYYICAYATNRYGTGYGEILSISTKSHINNILFRPDILYETVNDVDGNTYKAIKISSKGTQTGTQIWMAENLRTTKFNDGSSIPLETGDWNALSTPAYCWYNDTINTYGALYNWYVINTGKLCPTGWHVPTHEEWIALFTTFGGWTEAGARLKESGTSHWVSPNTGTNESGFTALPGGVRDDTHGNDPINVFSQIGLRGMYTSSTSFYSNNRGFVRIYTFVHNGNSVPTNEASLMTSGVYVRCVKSE